MDLKEKFGKLMNKKFILPALLVAASLLVLSSLKSTAPETELTVAVTSDELEEKVAALCRSVKGVREARVLLTLDTSEEYVIAKDVERNGDYMKSTAVSPDSGGRTLCVISPKVRGVAVVCTGGDKPSVKAKIISLVSSSLGIDSSKISVAGT